MSFFMPSSNTLPSKTESPEKDRGQEGTGSERYLPSPIAGLKVLIAIISVASLAVGHSRECSSITADHLNNKTLILVVMTKAAPLHKTTRRFARALSWSAKIQSTELRFC